MIAFLRPSGLFIYIYMLYSKIHSSERCTHRRHTTTSFEVALRAVWEWVAAKLENSQPLQLLVNTVHNGAPGVYKPAYVHCRVVTLTRPASILAVGAAHLHDDGPEFSHHRFAHTHTRTHIRTYIIYVKLGNCFPQISNNYLGILYMYVDIIYNILWTKYMLVLLNKFVFV